MPVIHNIKEGDWVRYEGNYFRMWSPQLEVVTDGTKAGRPLGHRLSLEGEDIALMEMRGADADLAASRELNEFLLFSPEGQQLACN